MKNSLFTPSSPEWQEIGQRLNTNKGMEHLQPGGSLELARQYAVPAAQAGDIRAMMLMANVYYTIVGAVGPLPGWRNKLRAVMYLGLAKQCATDAFTSWAKVKDLETSILWLSYAIRERRLPELGYGDIHILMSCYVQWANQIRRRLHLSTKMERIVAETCQKAIRSGEADENLKLLADGTMLKFPGLPVEAVKRYKKPLYAFIRLYDEPLLSRTNLESVDRGLVQTFCRVARTLEEYDIAEEVARKYGLHDQAEKAHNRS